MPAFIHAQDTTAHGHLRRGNCCRNPERINENDGIKITALEYVMINV